MRLILPHFNSELTQVPRFEPLGVVIFSVLMIGSFIQVLVESVQRLWAALYGDQEEIPSLPLGGIAIMLVTVVLKAFMWVIYRKSRSSGVRAVAQGMSSLMLEVQPADPIDQTPRMT